MRATVNMVTTDSIHVEAVILNSRASTEQLITWLQTNADLVWPQEKEEDDDE